MNDEDIVCYCSNVTKRQILDALNSGAQSLNDIRRMTGACTDGNCKVLSPRKKCCSPVIIEIIQEYKHNND